MDEDYLQPQRTVAFYGGALRGYGEAYLEFLAEAVRLLKAEPNAISFRLPERKGITSYKTRKSKSWLDIVREKGVQHLAAIEQIEDNDYRKCVAMLSFPFLSNVTAFSAEARKFSLADGVEIAVHYEKLCDYHYGFSQVRRSREASVWAWGIASGEQGKEERQRVATLGWALRDEPEILARKMHDLYEMNILSPGHLASKLDEKEDLRHWITRQRLGTLTPITKDLTTWVLTPAEIAVARPVLLKAGALIVPL